MVLAALLLAATDTGVGAEQAVKVLRLRTEKVALYDCKDGSKKSDFSRGDFKDPWPVVGGSPAPPTGMIRVQVAGQPYCVRAYVVETDRPIAASAECGAVVASSQQKSAATRGLGEECKR
jgi:hypothetical protein